MDIFDTTLNLSAQLAVIVATNSEIILLVNN